MHQTIRLIPRWFAVMILASLAIVMYGLGQPSDTETFVAIKAHVDAKADPFRLGALHVMTTLTG